MARSTSHRTTRRDGIVGWVLVAIQAVLLVTLVVVLEGTTWAVTDQVRVVAISLIAVGLALGAFRWIRHPMHTAVMTVALGITLWNAGGSAIALFVATGLFFNVKARWEDRRLVRAYGGYAEYRQSTGRFLPRFGPGELRHLPR